MTQKPKQGEKITCSFCGRSSDEVSSIIAGPDVYICDLCVSSSVDIIRNNMAAISAKKHSSRGTLSPTEIKRALDEYVIG
ncbi:MAG: ATP-dependent Clp protease ATP-binding subunit ClpX, partial [Ignavibacteriales bacterium]|nr:ATP-dependent Clp protease ATP-binding subunit ClpX [Ignavibacteriales bacterium]